MKRGILTVLDKTIPYAKLYMKRKAGTPIPQFLLPQGFRFVMFRDGDETHWARIETSVAEFDGEFAALLLFKEQFIPHSDELYRRLLFIETCEGVKVATANAWWSYINKGWRNTLSKDDTDERRAWVHWVSVDPKYQGLGLGKAVTSRVMEIMRDIEGDVDMYLSTQTWSYKAVDIYKKCGFEPTDEELLYRYNKKEKNDYKKAIKILDGLKR